MPGPLLLILFCCIAGPSYTQQIASLPEAPEPGQASDATPGTIRGTVVDPTGSYLLSAHVKLTRETEPKELETTTDAQGQFTFTGIPPGPFRLTISAQDFATQERSGVLQPGESLLVTDVSMPIPGTTTEVRVTVSNYELAEEQVKIQESQRVLGVIPNFYVSYQQNTLPLHPRQKFELAWRTTVDPVTFAASGVFAGIQQAQDTYSGYGQGAQGYAKRYAASYADSVIGIMIGDAILPSVLKQDPRYFYKGTGSIRSRIFYALANAVICKGDNGKWQVDYSGILGSLAAGGISNLYYPAGSRNGVGLTFQNTLIGIGGSGIANIFQEFVVRKLTPNTHGPQSINP